MSYTSLGILFEGLCTEDLSYIDENFNKYCYLNDNCNFLSLILLGFFDLNKYYEIINVNYGCFTLEELLWLLSIYKKESG